MKMRKKKYRGIRLIAGFCLFLSLLCGFGVQKVSATPLQEEQELDYILGRQMTEEEIREQKALEPDMPSNTFELEEIVPSVGGGTQKAKAVPLPVSYDSRNSGLITPVKNQGQWGTCWSHAVVACAESSLLAKEMMTMEQANLSELHLAYFLYHTPQDPMGNAVGDQTIPQGKNYLDRGGNARMAVFPLSNFVGFADEATAPYKESEMPEDLDEGIAYTDAAHLKNSYWLAPSDTAQIKAELMELGAASVSVYMDTDNYYNYDTAAYYCDLTDSGTNHAVTVVGWDDGYSAENFKSTCRPVNDGAWLVKNSWGEKWGAGGYFWLSYEDALINKSNFSFFDAETAKAGQKNYHYDGSAGTSVVSLGNGSSIANIYQASGAETGAEKIDAVSFVLGTPNVQYEIQIYKNVTDKKNPESGIPVLESPQSGTLTYCGYHTIPLEENITVGKNEAFAIVVTVMQESGEKISYHVDNSQEFKNLKGEVWCKMETSEYPEQSFYKYGPQNPWVDTYNRKYTMRLKGLTLPVEPVPVSSVSLKEEAIKLRVSDQKRLEAAVTPMAATDYSLTWTSSNQEIAKVDNSGMVTAVSPGECVITAACADGKQVSCTVNVWEVEKVTGLEVVKADTSSIQFKWNKQAGVNGYQVYRYDGEKEVWNLLGYLEGEDCNSYTDQGLKSGTSYWYKVNACVKIEGNDVFGDFSEFFKAITAARKTLSFQDVTLSRTSYTYDGKAKNPAVTVKDGDKVLKEGTDYTVAYQDNINVGTAKVIVTGQGDYTGTVTKAFTIAEAVQTKPEVKSLSKCTTTLNKTSYAYDGKVKKPAVTVKDGKTVLKLGTDYTAAYQNNKNAGKAKVIVTGKGNYQGTVTKTFTITVKKNTSHKAGSYQYKVTGTSTVSLTAVKNNRVTKVNVPKTVKIGGKGFKVTAIGNNAFKKNKKIATVEISDNVKTIGAGAFENCQKLNKVTVGKGTAEIGKNAFKNCKKLGNITIKSTKLKKVGANALRGIKPNAKIKVPAKKLSAYQKLFQNKGQGKKVKIVK